MPSLTKCNLKEESKILKELKEKQRRYVSKTGSLQFMNGLWEFSYYLYAGDVETTNFVKIKTKDVHLFGCSIHPRHVVFEDEGRYSLVSTPKSNSISTRYFR